VDNGSTEAIPNQLAACELTLTWISFDAFSHRDRGGGCDFILPVGPLMNVCTGNMKLHFPK
jgi:hypothetical protein